MINAFEVPAEEDEAFLSSDSQDATHVFQAATSQPELRNASVPYPFHASLYEVVRRDDQ